MHLLRGSATRGNSNNLAKIHTARIKLSKIIISKIYFSNASFYARLDTTSCMHQDAQYEVLHAENIICKFLSCMPHDVPRDVVGPQTARKGPQRRIRDPGQQVYHPTWTTYQNFMRFLPLTPDGWKNGWMTAAHPPNWTRDTRHDDTC